MSAFDDRERAFESKFARDQEVQFRITARRNRLVGEWAAERMGLTPEETAMTTLFKRIAAAVPAALPALALAHPGHGVVDGWAHWFTPEHLLPGLVAVVDEDDLLRVLGEDVRVLLG